MRKNKKANFYIFRLHLYLKIPLALMRGGEETKIKIF